MDSVKENKKVSQQEKQKRAIIYVFSGTGNTLIAAQHTAWALFHNGIYTDIYRIVSVESYIYQYAYLRMNEDGKFTACSASEKLTLDSSKRLAPLKESVNDIKGSLISEEFGIVPDPNSYDIAGFAYPIHAFNAPKFFLRFVKHLPALSDEKNGMPAFVFKTSGEPFKPNASSSRTLTHILKKKGYQPEFGLHMLMPYNIMFRYPKEMAKQMYLHTDMMSKKLADAVSNEKIKKPRYNPFISIFAFILRIQWFAAWFNGPLHKTNKHKCVGCEICVKNCPTGNIKMVPLRKDPNQTIPKMGWKCTMCMNCTMGCPKGAISPGFLTPWKVNPKWNFDQLMADDSISSNWTDSPDAGYFKLFRKYYSKYHD